MLSVGAVEWSKIIFENVKFASFKGKSDSVDIYRLVVVKGSHESNLLISTRGGLEFLFQVC
jgi:hypothetical protein